MWFVPKRDSGKSGSSRLKKRYRGEKYRRISRRGKRIGLWRLIMAIILIISFTTGAALAYFSPLFSLRTITVIGSQLVNSDQIRRISGAKIGTPLLQLDDLAIAERISRGFLPIKQTIVARKFPHTLVIIVHERVALAIIHDNYVIDADGVIFGKTKDKGSLPLLDTPLPGPRDAFTREALKAFEELPQSIRNQVMRITAPSLVSIAFTLKNTKVIVYGSAEDYKDKNIALAALLTRPGKVYNVSHPKLPIIQS